MAADIAVENGRILNFQGLVCDLDLGSGHTAYCRASLYLQDKFH